MTYYITGSNGFIGTNLVRYLQARGYEVVPLDIRNHNGKIKYTEPYGIVHLAAYGNHYNQQEASEIMYANIKRLLILIGEAESENLHRFYNISSSSVTLPKQTLYSASKLFGELAIEQLKDDRFVNVRPYSVYGPGEADHRFIPQVIDCLFTGRVMNLDEQATHDWIYVDDFIAAMLSGETEVGTGVSFSNYEVVQLLENIAHKELKFSPVTGMRPYDNKTWVCPKGVPHRSLRQGMKQTFEYYAKRYIKEPNY